MALAHEEIYTSTGTKPSVLLDPSITPFNVNVACVVGAGATASYKLQYTLSDVNVSDANALWFDSTDFPAATAASKVAPISAPVSRVRMVIATLTGGVATLTLQTLQGWTTN